MKQTILFLIILGIFSCKKDDETPQQNVVYEVAGYDSLNTSSKFNVRLIDQDGNIQRFDSVATGWMWQKRIDIGEFVGIEAQRVSDLDTITKMYVRLTVGGPVALGGKEYQVVDSVGLNLVSIWAKVE